MTKALKVIFVLCGTRRKKLHQSHIRLFLSFPHRSERSWRHLAVIASVCAPACGTHNCAGNSPFSGCSFKPLLSGFFGWGVDGGVR